METAVYWCGQAASLSHGEDADVLRWAESLIKDRQYHRATHILKEAKLETLSWKGCFLAANAMFLANNLEEATKILDANEKLVENATAEVLKSNTPGKEVRTSKGILRNTNVNGCILISVASILTCPERPNL